MNILQLDHLVLTVKDIDASISFYCNVLGMELIEFNENRKALKFGNQKINLHKAGNEITPHAQYPEPGSADLCFITDADINTLLSELSEQNIKIIEGPVVRTGANGSIHSIYIRDPDYNLIELASYIKQEPY